MHFSLQRFAAVAAAASVSLNCTPGLAAVYQALCSGGSECTVTLANGQIGMPGLVIQKDQVLSWSQGGSGSKTDVGMGVAGVVLFGVPGLIGFAAKKHDYQYTINYVDEAGNTQAASIGFKNNVPANQFMMEMMGMTGLSIGEVNKELQRFILLQADVTKNSTDNQALLKRFGLFGPPGILIFDLNSVEQKDQRVIGYKPPQRFIERLKKL
jgi:hypothetical protein